MTVSNFGLQVGFGSFSFDVAYLVRDGGAYKVARSRISRIMVTAQATTMGQRSSNTADQRRAAAQNNEPGNDWRVRSRQGHLTGCRDGFGRRDVFGRPDGGQPVHSMVDADDGDEQSGTMLSGSYTLAPGVDSKTSLFAAERDNADGSSVEGTGFVTGIVLSF